MTNPDKSALDAARERLEAECQRFKECYKFDPEHADVRLVLDALKEAEREVKRLHELADESRRVRGPLVARDNVRRWDEDDDCGNPEDWE